MWLGSVVGVGVEMDISTPTPNIRAVRARSYQRVFQHADRLHPTMSALSSSYPLANDYTVKNLSPLFTEKELLAVARSIRSLVKGRLEEDEQD